MNIKLKELRLKTGLNQKEFANKIGLSQVGYSKIERGDVQLTLKRIEKITEVFGINKDYLLNNTVDPSVDQKLENSANNDLNEIKNILKEILQEIKKFNKFEVTIK